jgi:hypothetical protein
LPNVVVDDNDNDDDSGSIDLWKGTLIKLMLKMSMNGEL